jgi:hypothetical protein
MPVRRYRSVEDMPSPRWRDPGDPDLYRALARVWTFGLRTRRFRFPPGVHRYRSIEELDAQVQSWQHTAVDEIRRARAERTKPPAPGPTT